MPDHANHLAQMEENVEVWAPGQLAIADPFIKAKEEDDNFLSGSQTPRPLPDRTVRGSSNGQPAKLPRTTPTATT